MVKNKHKNVTQEVISLRENHTSDTLKIINICLIVVVCLLLIDIEIKLNNIKEDLIEKECHLFKYNEIQNTYYEVENVNFNPQLLDGYYIMRCFN